jgi:hypothetical protein
MKIAVSKIRANPFRRIASYPIDKAKVEALKTSIRETEFWDNILLREKPGKPGLYELAYGHHRLQALKELGIAEIDVPVKDLDDATMLRIMAGENMDVYRSDPRVINETVQAARDFLTAELDRFESFEELEKQSDSNIILLIGKLGVNRVNTKKWHFSHLKAKGVGRAAICAFLGDNWKTSMVQNAISIINDETLDRAAAEKFPTMGQAIVFRETVKKYDVPKEEHAAIADAILERGQPTREIPRVVEEHIMRKKKEVVDREIPPEAEDLEAKKLKSLFIEMVKAGGNLAVRMKEFEKQMNAMGADSVSGPEAHELTVIFRPMVSSIWELSRRYGLGLFSEIAKITAERKPAMIGWEGEIDDE